MARENTNNSVTRDVTVVHFLLMFGYKLFSAYFPLFLLSRNFSLPQVAWAFLLIYLPIAVFAPLVGFWARKTNPALLMALGICGYAIYALMMIFDGYNMFFYFWQLMLGVSASLFFTSSRILLIDHPLKIVERGFSWFYNAPIWADMVAPVIGAYLLWKTNFPVIFSVSFGILMLAVIYNFRLWGATASRGAKNFSLRDCFNNWKMLFSKLVTRKTARPIFLSFAMLWQSGLYAAFFVIFLKNRLAWDKGEILLFVPLAAVIFSLFYVVAIKPRQKDRKRIKYHWRQFDHEPGVAVFCFTTGFLEFLEHVHHRFCPECRCFCVRGRTIGIGDTASGKRGVRRWPPARELVL